MKHQVLSFVIMMAGGIVIAGSPNAGLAADKVDYSGKYSAVRGKQTPSGSADSTLEVVQSEDYIEMSWVQSGQKTTTRCPFNGSLGDYTNPRGVSGKCKAKLKGRNLIIEAVGIIQQQRVHTKEQWQLSNDAKILTIKLDAEFPDPPPGIHAILSHTVTTKYTRTENP